MRKWPGLSETAKHVHHNLWWDLSGNPDKGPRTSLWRHCRRRHGEAFLFVDTWIQVSLVVLWFPDRWCALQYSRRTSTNNWFFPSHREFVQLSRHWQSWWQDLLPGGPYARSLLTLVRVSWHFICHLCPSYIVLMFFLSYYLLYVSTMFMSNLHFWSWSWE